MDNLIILNKKDFLYTEINHIFWLHLAISMLIYKTPTLKYLFLDNESNSTSLLNV